MNLLKHRHEKALKKREEHIKNRDILFTRHEAAEILELFEDILDMYNITVPSPEDDERDEGNQARLYGSVYWDLLDNIEGRIVYCINQSQRAEVVTDVFE